MPDDAILADIAGHTMIEVEAAPADEPGAADAAPPAPAPVDTRHEARVSAE